MFQQFIFVFSTTALAIDLPITPDGTTNTNIDTASNGVAIVNIATPNAGGLSHNKFENYNVNESGLILNNAIGNPDSVVRTQIGGLVVDNSNLKNSGSASIILNEITSNNISQINGYTEIAGRKADLILANPNGFVFNGSGFINVNRLTAVVGSSNQFNPNPADLTFKLSDNSSAIAKGFLPKLVITGNANSGGFDLENINATDLVANMLNIVAPIYGGNNEINILTGDKSFNYLTKEITSNNIGIIKGSVNASENNCNDATIDCKNIKNNSLEALAVDASALGKIQAGKIYVLATKEGFGIKYSGDLLASRSGIIIDSQGNIDYNNIASEVGNIEISSKNGSINSRGIVANKNINSDIKINAKNEVINSGKILSARDIFIESKENFINESAFFNISDNNFYINAKNFVNSGTIIANSDLNIQASEIIINGNSNLKLDRENLAINSKLIANKNLILNAPQIINEASIYANKKINITANNYITNNKDIISLGFGLNKEDVNDGIEINAKTLNNNKQISANNNIIINANILKNNNANSAIIAFKNVNINTNYVDNSLGKIQAKNNLILRNLTPDLITSKNQFLTENNALNIVNNQGKFYSESFLDFDLGNNDYTILGNLESNANLKIKANKIINQGNVLANDSIEIIANDNFSNGMLSGNNADIKIIANNNLKITASNLLSNYAILSSKKDLMLTSINNNINNNVNAEIIGGLGLLSLIAKNGAVNQNSLNSIVANGDYGLEVFDFVNTGRVDVAGNLTLNVANNLINQEEAMIFSGGNMALNVVNNLTNKPNAIIHSEGNLTIQKYSQYNLDGSENPLYNSTNNNSKLVDNIVATIEAVKDIKINSAILNNKGIDYDPDNGGFFGYNKSSLVSVGDWGQGYYNLMYEDRVQSTLRTSQAFITSLQGKIEINNANVTNSGSSISAMGDIVINNGSFNNITSSILVENLQRQYGNHWTNKSCNKFGFNCKTRDHWDTSSATYSVNATSADVANIKAGGKFILNKVIQVNNGYLNNGSGATIVLSASKYNEIITSDVINIDLSPYFARPDAQGLFKKSTNPNAPLFETRSQFIDQSKFFGSNYFYERIGFDLSALQTQFDQQNQRLVGDQFFQNKIISEQLRTISKNSFLLSKDNLDANIEIKSLIDNASLEFKRLGLSFNKSLTKEQIKNLQKDIVWFETEKIDGAVYIVPKIYLAQATKDSLKNNLASQSTIFAKEDIAINANSGSFINSGSIIGGGNISLFASGDIVNKDFSQINAITGNLNLTSSSASIANTGLSSLKAGNNLTIFANKDIKNIGSKIEALGNVNLISSSGNILSTAVIATNDANLLTSNSDSYVENGFRLGYDSGNIKSEVLQDASIKGGSITINAGNDFTNLASNISTTKNILPNENILSDASSAPSPNTTSGNISINAGDDITIATLELRNRSETRWGGKNKGGTNITDSTTNIGSEIESAGNLSLITTGNGVDSEILGNSQVSNLQGSDIQITGSNLKALQDTGIISKDDIIIEASQDTSYQQTQSWKKGLTVAKSSTTGSESITNNLATLTSGGDIVLSSLSDTNLIGAKLKADNVAINAGNEVNIYSVSDQTKTWESYSKSRNYSSITAGLVGASAPLLQVDPLTVGAITAIHLGLDTNNSSKSSSNSNEKSINLASVIEAKKDIAISSNQDLTILGSDISGATGNLTSNQGNVNILSSQEIEKNISSNKSVERATNIPGFKGGKESSSETIEIINNIASNLNFNDSLTIQTNGNSTDPNQKADVNIKGSNLAVTNGDLTIASQGNLNIENAVDSYFKETSTKKSNEVKKSLAKTVDYIETASSSNLSANNINISSLGDTLIQASNIDTKENLMIGSFAIAKNLDDQGNLVYQKDGNGNYITISGSTVDNLTIKDADLKEYHYASKVKGYTGIAGAVMQALPYINFPIQGILNIVDVNDAFADVKVSQSQENRIDKTTSNASTINVGGSMMTNSVGDTLIKGSNLNIAGDLLANSLGNFSVVAGVNTQSSASQNSYQTAGEFHSNLDLERVKYQAGVKKEFVEEGTNFSSSTVAGSNVNIGGSALVNSSDQFALIASNFVANDSIEIIAKNNLDILDGKNTQSSSTYQEKITLDTGIKIGNAYADAGNAVIDALKATKEIKDSYDKLEKIKDLKDQGMASSKAVERAEYQVYLALLNAGLSSANAMQAVANAGASASTSFFTGFYGSIYADITKLKSTSTTESSQSIASNLIANNTINLASGNGDINITGSNVSSINGDLNLNAMLGNINIKAGESTASQSYKMNSQTLGGSIGTNGLSSNIGFSEAQSSFDQTTFSNSQILAINGSLNINSANDTKIIGANLIASNVNMNIGNNLLLKSKQNLLESDSYNIGMSIGISGDSNGINGGSFGLNLGNGYSNRAFVDQVSSIIATNLVNINVANDTNIVGALIANQNKEGIDLGNLTLNTKTFTYSDLNNFSIQESNQLGLNLQAGYNPNNPTQNGNLAIKLNMQGRESSSITKATIGKGEIIIKQELNQQDGFSLASSNSNSSSSLSNLNRDVNNFEQNKRDVITSDFDSEIKIDLRLISAVANLAVGNTDKATANWDSYANQTVDGAKITKKIIPKIWASPNTAIGLAYGGAGYLYGSLTNQNVKVSVGNNAIQFEGNPLGDNGSALTLGNTIQYFGDSYPNQERPSGYNSEILINLGNHEREHTYQYEVYGPFFLPLYLLNGGISDQNSFEQKADEASKIN